jgi:hypothetical protein
VPRLYVGIVYGSISEVEDTAVPHLYVGIVYGPISEVGDTAVLESLRWDFLRRWTAPEEIRRG